MRGKVTKVLRKVARAIIMENDYLAKTTTARAVYKELKKMHKRKV